MIEREVDLWKYRAAAVVITTNGKVKKNGECVMGRGCAREAALRWPDLASDLGKLISETGNHCYALRCVSLAVAQPDEIDEMPAALGAGWTTTLVSFPVKDTWQEAAKLSLIARSAGELLDMADQHGWDKVVMPRPGCGNGQLEWDSVKRALAPLLDDRFIVVTFPVVEF